MQWLRPLSILWTCVAMALAPARATTQTTGRIDGTVLDSATSALLANVTVTVVGTKVGATTNEAGR